MLSDPVGGLLTATLIGAAIGLERQWSGHASGEHARFGGIRTLTMLGVVGGVSGWMALQALWPFAIVLLASAALLVVAGYHAASRVDIDGTTEVAALVVLTAGALAGAGYVALASALGAGTLLLLLEKTRLHAIVRRLDDASLRASARFAAMACIVLPLLPAGPYGPYDAIRPRELWAVVLFLSGLSFLGWIAQRLAGAERGLIIAGLLGGIISSTSVTLQLARGSRRPGSPGTASAAAAIGACTVMLLRVTLVCAVLNPSLGLALLRHTTLPFLLGVAMLAVLYRTNGHAQTTPPPGDSPLRLRDALQMTLLFQLVLFVIAAVRASLGPQLLVATAVLVGSTDLDALTISLARSNGVVDGPSSPVVIALVAGIVSNTIVKGGFALVVGRGRFRVLTVTTLALLAGVMTATVWWS